MKDESSMQSTVISLSSSLESQNGKKYQGMIKKGILGVIKVDMLRLFSYMYNVSPNVPIVSLITVIRVLQFIGPSFCLSSNILWDKTGQSSTMTSLFSICAYFVPFRLVISSANLMTYMYLVVKLTVIITLIIASQVLKSKSKLPFWLSTVVTGYFSTFGEVFHCAELYIISVFTSNRFFVESSYDSLLQFFLVITVTIIYIVVVVNISSQGIAFRPGSMMTVSTNPQNYLFIAAPITTLISASVSYAPKGIQQISVLLMMLLYLFYIKIGNSCGGFIHKTSKSLFIASCLTGFLNTVLISIFLYTNQLMKMYIYFISGSIFIALILIGESFYSNKMASHLELLDRIMESEEAFEEIRSTNEFLAMMISGYHVAHPICLNWLAFKLATNKWEKETDIWFSFAKFVSIFPEENQTLAWIFHSVSKLKLKGNNARTIKMESIMISREREFDMCPVLKDKLNSISKRIQGTKHKIRHLWDIAIQGNIQEIEPAAKKANIAIDNNDADFKHLFGQFPNNRFVTRAYSRFLIEIRADHERGMDMMEKTNLLQKGILVNPDHIHELGLQAFESLPSEINTKKRQNNQSHFQTGDNFQLTMTEIDIDVADETKRKAVGILKEKIDTLSFPSIRSTFISRILFLTLFFVSAFVGIIIAFQFFFDDLMSPIKYVFEVARIRQFCVLATTFVGRYVLQSLDIVQRSDPLTEKLPLYLGSSWNSIDQLKFLLIQMAESDQIIGTIRNYKKDVKLISDSKAIFFNPTLNYSMYKSLTEITYGQYSIQTALVDYLLQIEKVTKINESAMTYDILESTMMMNVLKNLESLTLGMNKALSILIDYIKENNNEYNTLFKYLLVILVAIAILGYFGLMQNELKSIESNKTEVYRCLTSLPKNVVSSIAENMRVIKKEGDSSSTTNKDSELSKQEENILKVLSTAGSGYNSSSDGLPIIICSIILCGLHFYCTYVLYQIGIFQTQTLLESVPHIDYLHAAFGEMFSAIAMMNYFSASYGDHYYKLLNQEQYRDVIENRITRATDYFHLSWYGGQKEGETPFLGFSEILERANQVSMCQPRTNTTRSLIEELKCTQVDNVFNMMVPLLIRNLQESIQMNSSLDSKDPSLRIVWDFMIYPVYEEFFAPMANQIVPTIKAQMQNKQSSDNIIVIICILVAIIVEVLLLMKISDIESHMRFVLSMLQHCPPTTVMQTPKIVSILSGNFSQAKGITSKRDEDFYDLIYNCLPDPIAILSVDGTIKLCNNEFQKKFNINNESKKLIGDIITNERFQGDFGNIIQLINGSNSEIQETLPDQTCNTYKISCYHINETDIAITLRDITQTVRYNTLIREERAKSDELLSSILPPSLVPRVQKGEKNISFAIQSVSIVFIDIVEFTPWCGSLPASMVMSTLNNMFQKYDMLVAKYSTMTKIKCVGDCYIAAGGVFSEINQPIVHAKEAVDFGLDVISAIEDLNKELNQNLKIRVGINTGGPVVGGVLGIGKPTFEILGPTINMAQQMEHHGVPMAVHISRPVYELIYGNTFKIKERGLVEIKGGSVNTYLVTGRL